MQQLAAFPRGSIGRTDLPAIIRAVNTTLACATAVRAKPRLLSDLGKTLQAQPDLRRGLRRSPEFRAHVASLFSLASADPCSFSDAVNVSQLATAQIKTGHYSPAFWTGLERAGLRGLPPRQFANVVYAAAKLHADLAAPRPSPGLQQRVWHAVEAGGHRMAAGMSPQHVSNVWWALATLDLEVPPATLDVLKAATVRVAPEMAPQNVSIVLWAWATLRLRPERIVPPLTATLPRVVPLMSDQHLSNVCWAWGALMLPAAEAVPILQAGFLRLAAEGEVSEQALSNVWWAWARLHVSDDGIAACFHAVLAQHAQHAEPLTAVVVLKAVATLARPPPPPLFMQLMRVVTQGGEEMGVWECSNVLWGLGVMAVVRGGPVSVATARGGAPAADGDAVAAAYDEAVQHLAARLLEFHEADVEFAQEALNQVRHLTLCWACSAVPARLPACVLREQCLVARCRRAVKVTLGMLRTARTARKACTARPALNTCLWGTPGREAAQSVPGVRACIAAMLTLLWMPVASCAWGTWRRFEFERVLLAQHNGSCVAKLQKAPILHAAAGAR